MITYSLVPQNWTSVHNQPRCSPVSLSMPVEIDENYFDKLAVFGLACVMAAIAGKLVMGSMPR